MILEWSDGSPPESQEPARRLVNEKLRKRRWEKRIREMDDSSIPSVIAWDGEGYGDLDHRFVILADSRGHEIRNPNGLSTLSCLELLWKGAACDPEAINVFYGGTYDFNNTLRDVDRATAEAVQAGKLVKLGPYLVRFNGAWLEIERAHRKYVYWDVWRFWGCPFGQALEECIPNHPGLAMIKEMKQQRSAFHADMLEEMSVYNRQELDALEKMTQGLFRDLIEARIRRPTYLTGAGALAGSLLNQYGVLDHNRILPDEVQSASLVGYFGGRIEPWKVGTHRGTVHGYDIRNAYCYALMVLPSLREGHWEWHEGDPRDVGWEGRLSVWDCEWSWDVTKDHLADETASYFPFPYRHKSGSVTYPNWGRGWYWWPEVSTALDLGWKFRVRGGWVWHPETDALPFGWVPAMYKHRMALKAAHRIGAARVVKFAMNALYGKLCQARGHTSWDPPAHHNLAWAGWVTSHCRAQLMAAVHQKPWAVLYVMTDGIATTEPLDLDIGGELGQWEASEYDAAQVVQAGVATLWKDGTVNTEKYRGFDPGSVTPLSVEEAWKVNYLNNAAEPMVTQIRRPVNLSSALIGERFDLWNSWIVSDRALDLYGGGGKRWRYWDTNQYQLWLEMAPLAAWSPNMPGAEVPVSYPYQPKWSDKRDRFSEVVAGGLRDRDIADVRSAEIA